MREGADRLMGSEGSDGLRRSHFTPVIMPAGIADMMRALELAAIRAFGIGRGRQRMMGAAHIAARAGGSFLRNGHRNKLVG